MVANQFNSKTASTSTETPKGKLFVLTAARVCIPISPKIKAIKSEAPFITFGCSINSSVEFTKPVRIMKGQYGPYIKYKSLNATIPEEKDPSDLTMEEALILIEKRKEYDKSKKNKRKKK